ncbi:Acetyl-CoA hydrolase/transferase N-terminal domain protein [Acididesulfobacillus acetoxydans]|uniref:Probable butyrate:acetyl-CoA coenzyme A-transferase n=1 Tax=Acididesulfobacillus acetoxydans TaxID=1561005 RepID=A0A8S0WH28_9FIRM|nr:acetyl-CoA hydrolase/transferase C-terminal domain-containing protein [Acididesulfobacillus acetoxydans]CAA7602392.1 Acetyl-CoA hydrolase/transferase N-terminal domain protein [Acididesulfobacillus acetoxydans]CEJ08373.1 4-hydroxybutyrate coenzyme A transferase [Acididesulfobacillus acetoxydans]
MFSGEYRRKCVSADTAVKAVKSGDWIEFGWAASMPKLLDEALARRRDELTDVKLRGAVLTAPLAILESDPEARHFLWNSWHYSGLERQYGQKGQAYYIPIKYSQVPRYIRENLRTDVAMIQVAPMDRHGYFNFGVTISHFAAAAEKAQTVIVEVNEDMPQVQGGYDHVVHISQVDYIVEGGHLGLPVLPTPPVSDIDRQIAGQILPDIEDGACVQLGIGGMPNALGKMIAQSDLRDLGVHSEMLVDAFADMVEAGRVNGRRKQIDRGRVTFSFAAGSQRLYDFMKDNPVLAAYPVDYVNHPCVASRNERVVSINSALEVDLAGQVCSETLGPNMVSGSGGQLDFVEAAYLSKNGKSFICLPAAYRDKAGQTRSRIKPLMTYGAVITDTRASVQYIVTEYGKVNLKGLASWQRAEALIGIAHPDFRDELIQEAEKMGIWRNSQKR